MNSVRTWNFFFFCFFSLLILVVHTLNPVLSDHTKIVKTKVLKTNGSLMKVKSNAECSL